MLITLVTNLSYAAFLTTPFFTTFFTTLFSLLKSTRAGTKFSISNLSISVFRLAKFVFNTKLQKVSTKTSTKASTCEIFLISDFVAYFKRPTLILIFPPEFLSFLGKY